MSDQNAELRKVGLKVTLPRVKILQILENSLDRHLSAEDVYKALIDRVLTQFETAELVTRHNFDGGHSVFELDRGDHHDHMVHMDTGDVLEFTNDQIERLQHEIAESHGYELVDHSLVLYVRAKK